MIKKSLLTIILFFFVSGPAECNTLEPSITLTNLTLTTSAGHEPYIHNGCVLTVKGTTTPHAELISAYIEDDQDRMIREVSKSLKINPNTGDISGSLFIGSLRGAVSIHLDIKVQDQAGRQFAKGTSNRLFIDNSYPEVRIIKPLNHAYCKTAPIMIYGTASDNISGIASVEISLNGGLTYCHVDSFRIGQWEYAFMPTTSDTEYDIKARSTDRIGLATVSDNLSIHYTPPPPTVKKTAEPAKNRRTNYSDKNATKSPDDTGICTYRIINLKKNRFQPTDLFTLNERMAIIVKGYGGNVVTVKIIDPSSGKVVFELTDHIPADKEKMWEWKVSKTGDFQAALVVNGIEKDDVYFKIIQ